MDQDLMIVFRILQLDIINVLLKKDDPWNLVISFVDVALNWKHVDNNKNMTFMIWFLYFDLQFLFVSVFFLFNLN
jgi:hypothetical protein